MHKRQIRVRSDKYYNCYHHLMQDTNASLTEEKYNIKPILLSVFSGFTLRCEGDQRGAEGEDTNAGTVYFQKEELGRIGEAY